ncbi:hypothetical protein Taro_050944 [Colocasia esculenta]|uniref:PGG domain-containing protein n=1 Tax=Colocasia esculenta TaxID=4460 RepID=A0A843XEP6_COLES|nr:hypothetical protein [Colocasia esculenta]
MDHSEIELQVLRAEASPSVAEAVNPAPQAPPAYDAGAVGGDDAVLVEWLKEMRGTLMLVAVLIASLTYQAGLNPPGGMWQDSQSSDGVQGRNHTAGLPVMRDVDPAFYGVFKFANTVAFPLSLALIMLLTRESTFRRRDAVYTLQFVLNGAVLALGMAYGFAYSPEHEAEDLVFSLLQRYLLYLLLVVAVDWTLGGRRPPPGRRKTWILYALWVVTMLVFYAMGHFPGFARLPYPSDVLLAWTCIWSV